MPTVQTTYSETHDAGTEGMLHGTEHRIDTYRVEGDTGIGFGLAVKKGTKADLCKPGMDAGDFLGVSVKDPTLIPRDKDKYTKGNPIAIMSVGDIWVKADGAVTFGENVSVTESTGRFGSKSLATTGTLVTNVPNGKWMTSAGDGKLAIMRIGVATIDLV